MSFNKYIAHCSEASADGRWHARYPAGNAPNTILVSNSADRKSAAAALSPRIAVGGAARALAHGAAALGTAIALAGAPRAVASAEGALGSVPSAGAPFVIDINAGSVPSG
ncbi:MAG: hypothetical protein ACYDAE_17290, partial [Steroidobacteraceae bacterium]